MLCFLYVVSIGHAIQQLDLMLSLELLWVLTLPLKDAGDLVVLVLLVKRLTNWDWLVEMLQLVTWYAV